MLEETDKHCSPYGLTNQIAAVVVLLLWHFKWSEWVWTITRSHHNSMCVRVCVCAFGRSEWVQFMSVPSVDLSVPVCVLAWPCVPRCVWILSARPESHLVCGYMRGMFNESLLSTSFKQITWQNLNVTKKTCQNCFYCHIRVLETFHYDFHWF